jgi:lipoprotein-anchoring transpeptidase ErfK/SrfK
MAAVLMIGAVEALAESPVRQIVVSIPDRKLVLLEDGKVKKVYDIAVGKASTPSPTGTFHIASHVKNPTWYGPKIVVPPGKANPLGTRWMGLGYKGYGIHGTNAPKSIGKAASHGCIRMRVADAEDLFTQVNVGDEVQLVGERNEQIAKLLPAPPPDTTTPAPDTAGGLQ